MTTNATLLTDEIVDFLYENGVSLTISLDGPQNVQDNSRVFAESGKGTFEVIMGKLDHIKEKYPGYMENISFKELVKAIKNERIEEHCQPRFEMKRILVVAGATAGYTVLAGIAFGFLNTGLITILIMVGCFSVICIIAGMYTGYHFGYEQKTKVYIVGAILFWIAGIDVLEKLVHNII